MDEQDTTAKKDNNDKDNNENAVTADNAVKTSNRTAKEGERVIALARNPNPNAEAESQFMTEEERQDRRDKEHELAMLSKHQGLIGKFIGSTVPSLNIAFFLLTVTLVVIVVMVFWGDYSQLKETIDKLIALELTIVGYILGKGTNNNLN